METYQVNAGDVFEGLGLQREPYRDPDARLPNEIMKQVWNEAERLSGDPCFGFRVGMSFHVTNYHAVGYAWLSSASIHEALDRMVRYQKLISTAVDLKLEAHESELHYVIGGPDMPPQAADAASCAAVQICRDVSNQEFAPIAVQLARPTPPCGSELRQFFGCEVTYDAPDTRLRLSTASVNEPLTRNNPALAQASEEIARDYIIRMDHNDVVTKARVLLIGQLPDGEPARSRLARSLNMSERTLARRLADHDYTFTSLVDEIRHELAADYLRQTRFSVTDVAFLLGFSDQSNFARAFKRWTDQTPSEFRLAAGVAEDTHPG
jgi:AraC-like DNA-binding protein